MTILIHLAAHVGILKGNLLQTSRARIRNIETEETLIINILFVHGKSKNLYNCQSSETVKTENTKQGRIQRFWKGVALWLAGKENFRSQMV